MSSLDIKIVGGRVLDGTGCEPTRTDVGIAGDRLVELGDLGRAESRLTLDARGGYVAPGFIDIHSHSDINLLIEPSAPSKISQGITTEVIGNCGTSAAPLTGQYRLPSEWRDLRLPGRWSTVAEYRAVLEAARPAPNVVLLAGHNNLRGAVLGYGARRADGSDLKAMEKLLEAALAEGARGLSSGLIYTPGMFAAPEELEALAWVAARHGGLYTTHMRSESSRLLEALDETIALARGAGVRVQVSHLKTAGRANWGLLDAALERLGAARRAGIEIAADRYPYTASSTSLDSIFPDWAVQGGHEAVLGRLRGPAERARLRESLLASRAADYWATVMISATCHPETRRFQGMMLVDAAAVLNMAPVDALLHLVERDELRTGGIFFGMSESNLWRILAEPYVMIGTDASLRAPGPGPLGRDHPHPRAYGTFPLFIRAALDGRTVPLPEAVRKATSLPASRLGLADRGVLARGKAADVVVFDPGEFRDAATYAAPHQLARGLLHVVVNGVPTVVGGKLGAGRGGRVL